MALNPVYSPSHELEIVLENAGEVIWFADYEEQQLTSISSACLIVYGYTPLDFMNNYNLLKEVVHPDDRRIIDRDERLLCEGKQVKSHYRILHKDGNVRYVAAKITPLLTAEGRMTALCGMVIDITSQKRANRALQQSEYLYRQFFENAYEAILVIDAATGLVRDYNNNALKLFKVTGTEILTVTPASFCPKYQPDGQKSITKAVNLLKHLTEEGNMISEWVMQDSDGKEILCELNFTTVIYNAETWVRISIVDVTEKKLSKTKLQEQDLKYAKLLENIHDGISVISATGEITYQSPSAVKIMGHTLEDLKGVTVFDLVYADDLEGLSQFFSKVLANPGRPYTSQFRFKHKNGQYLWVEGTMSNLLHDETMKGFVVNYRVIEERKQIEAEIAALNESLETKVRERTAQLLEANRELEAFNYTVSHDLQAPLRGICGFSKLLLEEEKDNLTDEGRRFLKVIDDSSQHMNQLIRDLLDFSRLGKQELKKRAVSMTDLVRVVTEEVKCSLGNSHFTMHIHSLPEANGDLGLLKQVWANLVGNAVKYSSKAEEPVIEVGCSSINNENVYYIRDNGAGFDMKLAEKLFAVFKRLHNSEEFEGTGVGLATVQRILARHGGRIWAEAEVGKGATFYFTLPL